MQTDVRQHQRHPEDKPANITLTDQVVWALAKLWHSDTVHYIVFATDKSWRVLCTSEPVDENHDYDIAPKPPVNCGRCTRLINWNGDSYPPVGRNWAY